LLTGALVTGCVEREDPAEAVADERDLVAACLLLHRSIARGRYSSTVATSLSASRCPARPVDEEHVHAPAEEELDGAVPGRRSRM
jgi:hypothetical protein